MLDKIAGLIQSNTITVPKLLLMHYRNLKLSEKQVIFLIYLIQVEGQPFNPKMIASELGLTLAEVMEEINNLSNLDLVKLEVKKINQMRDECINLHEFYHKLAFFVVNEPQDEPKKEVTIYADFEKEFGRTLSPMEYEIIHAWLDGTYTEELVLLALKEATFNGVSNLRYIDRILHDWNKKGIKTKEDVQKEYRNFKAKREQPKELFDYDWLNDNNE